MSDCWAHALVERQYSWKVGASVCGNQLILESEKGCYSVLPLADFRVCERSVVREQGNLAVFCPTWDIGVGFLVKRARVCVCVWGE